MKIAIIGTRGIPASYSGFETLAEQLSARLVERGHKVYVYCRTHHIKYRKKRYKGVKLVRLPTIRNKFFDTIVHTFLSIVHSIFTDAEIVYVCIVGNSILSILPRFFGKKVVLNVDGADWQREKWSAFAKAYLKLSERVACIFPDVTLTDSRVMYKYYMDNFKKETACIAYGSEVPRDEGKEFLEKFGLQERKYILFVGRLVPENNAHVLVSAYKKIEDKRGFKLVVVGDAPYAEKYKQILFTNRSSEIVFTGYLFGKGYRQLSSHAYLFVEPSGVGGTHPALVEAMGFGNCVIVNDMPANLETIGDAGFSYDRSKGADDLKDKLEFLIANPAIVEEYGKKSLARMQKHYSWNSITAQYEKLFSNIKLGLENKHEKST